MPHWVYVGEPLFSREYVFEAIEANVRIDDAFFDPPPGAAQLALSASSKRSATDLPIPAACGSGG